MSKLMDQAIALRSDPDTHFNCAQAVVIPFAMQAGMSMEQGYILAANFGGGMLSGLTCGAISGGLMALGISGVTDDKSAVEFIRRMTQEHEGKTNSRDLLAENAKTMIPKKVHCDNLVYESVSHIEEMLRERGMTNT